MSILHITYDHAQQTVM